MEKFISEIEAYTRALGITPQKLLRDALRASWGQWNDWKAGKSSPTMRNADRLREYMAENPPPAPASANAQNEDAA
ncbi:hypothetical protein [Roseinatronobacter sp.]|uniref:hypothetical protein n=1 Tax=Roseinatronobacter sp. TaxID=1945755 RepID=UPI003F6E92F5